MITDQNDMLGTLEDRNEGLWLGGLRRFVNQDLSEAEIPNPSIESGDTSGANDICIP